MSALVPSRGTGGRPEYQPSDYDRERVRAFAAAGYPQSEIAAYLCLSEKTLRKHFAHEIDYGAMELIGLGVGKLAHAIAKGEAWAICFLLKTKGRKLGWSENPNAHKAESDADGVAEKIIIEGGLPTDTPKAKVVA